MNTFESEKKAIGRAHSKLILIGEHAVVYGNPAIAVPFPLNVTATVTNRRNSEIILLSAYYSGSIENVPKGMQGLADCLTKTLQFVNKTHEGLSIHLQSDIPLGRGLGSSAAVAAAMVRSLFSFYDKPLTQQTLMKLVETAEVYAHGNPSGIDMEAVSSKYPIWFQKGRETLPLTVGDKMHVVVADSGQTSDTHSAVQKVRKAYKDAPLKIKRSIAQMETIAQKAKRALAVGDISLLGSLLDANQKELMIMGVSDHHLNQLIEVAKEAGACGAKLTGAGQGGCIIALAPSKNHAAEIREKLEKAEAQQTWYFSIDKNAETLTNLSQH